MLRLMCILFINCLVVVCGNDRSISFPPLLWSQMWYTSNPVIHKPFSEKQVMLGIQFQFLVFMDFYGRCWSCTSVLIGWYPLATVCHYTITQVNTLVKLYSRMMTRSIWSTAAQFETIKTQTVPGSKLTQKHAPDARILSTTFHPASNLLNLNLI